MTQAIEQLKALVHCLGVATSQEAVKMITGQYIPIDGNYIFNGLLLEWQEFAASFRNAVWVCKFTI
jgi:hypothetical protein